jgi:multiple sugar transport system substrate-binding protein
VDGGCNGTNADGSINPGNCVDPMMRHWGKVWQNMGNRQVIVDAVSFNSFEDEMKADFARPTPKYHGFFANMPSYMADYAGTDANGRSKGLADLTNFIYNDALMDFTDVLPFFREFINKFEGKVYTIMFDGDIHSLFYRSDVLTNAGFEVPVTIDELITQSAFFNGKDLNADGVPDYGFCLCPGAAIGYDTAYYESVIAPWLQTKGTIEGFFFDENNFDPIVHTAGFIEPLKKFKQLMETGTDTAKFMASDFWEPNCRSHFLEGRCAFSLDWGGLMRVSFRATPWAGLPKPYVHDKIRTSYFPGTDTVYDRTDKTMKKCTRELCPYAINHKGTLVNVAPLNAFAGFAVSLNGLMPQSEQQDAFNFVAWWNAEKQSSIDVVDAQSWFEPFRNSQFFPFLWLDAGMSRDQVYWYTKEMKRNLDWPNLAAELRVAGAPQYQKIFVKWVDFFMGCTYPKAGNLRSDDFSTRVYSNTPVTDAEYAAGILADFNALTGTKGGVTKQLEGYRGLLGYEKVIDCVDGQYRYGQTCLMCPPGYYCRSSRSNECQEGQFSLGNSSSCTNCKIGWYQASTAQTECTQCVSGFTTRNVGSRSAADCTCPVDQYMDTDGLCKACGVGISCAVGSSMAAPTDPKMTHILPQLQLGFWSTIADPMTVYECKPPDNCLGGPVNQNNCKGGTVGIVCGRCPDGEIMNEGQCEACSGLQTFSVVIGFVAILILPAFAFKAFNAEHHWKLSLKESAVITFEMLIEAAQVCSVITMIGFEMPDVAAPLYNAIAGINFDIVPYSCVLTTVVASYWFTMLWIPLMSLVTLALFGISQALPEGKRWSLEATMNTISKLLNVVFVSQCVIGTAPFVCYAHPRQGNEDVRSSMRSYPTVLCGEGDHGSLMVGGLISLLIATGFFGICGLDHLLRTVSALWSKRTPLHEEGCFCH